MEKFDFDFNIDSMLNDLAHVKLKESNDCHSIGSHGIDQNSYDITQDPYVMFQNPYVLLNDIHESNVEHVNAAQITDVVDEQKINRQIIKRKPKAFSPSRDLKTGRYAKSLNSKPPKMLEMEKKLNVLFNDDYLEKMVTQEWKKESFAKRWNVNLSLIFGPIPAPKRRWLDWPACEDLPIIEEENTNAVSSGFNEPIACCPISKQPLGKYGILEKAHFHSRKYGGQLTLGISPEIHSRMDKGSKSIAFQFVNHVLCAKKSWSNADVLDVINGIGERFFNQKDNFYKHINGINQ